jgi:hypothetical protein
MVEPIDTPRTLGVTNYQSATSEHPKVLGHRRAADGQLLGQLADRTWLPGQKFEDRAPAGVAKQTQSRISVSVHERSS